MATFTSNFALTKPAYGDAADIAVINADLDEIDEVMHDNRYMMADAWSSSVSYAVGDLCIYENALYKCVTATSGNWDATCWELTTLADNIGSVTVSKTASGNPIELSDGADAPMVSCVTEIVGSQDLHGYDKPWVGGAGRNILSYPYTDTTKSDNGIQFTDNGDGTIKAYGLSTDRATFVLRTLSDGYDLANGDYILSKGFAGEISLIVDGYSNGTWVKNIARSSSTNEVSFTVDHNGYNQIRIYFEILANTNVDETFYPMIRKSTAVLSTWEPYSNICPITAYTEGEIEVRGKNLFSYYDYPIRAGYWDAQNVFNGTNAEVDIQHASGWQYILIPVVAGKTITASNMLSSGGVNNAFLGSDNVTDIISTFRSVDINGTRVVPNGAKYLAYCGNHFDTNYLNYPNAQLEYGSSATTFEPYLGTTYTTTFPSTIYRGSEDVAEGSVTAEWGVVDLGNLTWDPVGSGGRFYSRFSANDNVKPAPSTSVKGNFICENYNAGSQSDIADRSVDGTVSLDANTQPFINILDTSCAGMTGADFKTHVTGVLFAYELATPTTSTVTVSNSPIRTLSGYSHIESSTGDMEVEYITKTYEPIIKAAESELGEHSEHYSTSERVVGKWIDGSTVYEKTFSGTTDGNNQYSLAGTFDANNLISYSGYIIDGSYRYGVPYRDGSDYISVLRTDTLRLIYSNYFRNKNFYVTIRYTKNA